VTLISNLKYFLPLGKAFYSRRAPFEVAISADIENNKVIVHKSGQHYEDVSQ